MFDIGIQEILVIMALALLVFGPDQLPELGRRLGRAMREFRRASDEFRRTVETNLNLDLDGHTPLPPSATDSTASAYGESGSAGGTTGEHTVTSTESPASVPLAEGAAIAEGAQANGDGLPVVVEPLEPFWTTRGGRLLHRANCDWRSRVVAADRVPVKTAEEGWDQGLQPCPACDPRGVAVAS
jgi:TatA/E family protein of Tat protein translocase